MLLGLRAAMAIGCVRAMIVGVDDIFGRWGDEADIGGIVRSRGIPKPTSSANYARYWEFRAGPVIRICWQAVGSAVAGAAGKQFCVSVFFSFFVWPKASEKSEGGLLKRSKRDCEWSIDAAELLEEAAHHHRKGLDG